MEFENETWREIATRISHNARSGNAKPWAPRLAKIEGKVIELALKVCKDPKIDANEARLEKAALHSLGRNKGDIERLIKYRSGKRPKAVAGDAAKFNAFASLLAEIHGLLEGVIVPPARGSREQKILEQIEHSVRYANEAEMDCPKIPKQALDRLLQWGREFRLKQSSRFVHGERVYFRQIRAHHSTTEPQLARNLETSMATEPAKTGDDDKAFAKFSDTLSKVISAIDGLCSRMDELDAKAEKSRKDSEDAAGEREKQMKDELEALKSHTNMQPEERSGFGEAQARANSVYRLNGKQAPPVMAGEKLFDYRRRLLAPLLKDSAQFAKINLAATNLDILDAIEPVVLADAAAAARDVSKIPGGQMRKTERRDATGRTITEWHGSWMASQPVPPISLRRVRPELMAGRI